MNRKFALTGLAAAATLALAGPASADILTGQVYQVTASDVYITMPDTTVARVPLASAQFKLDGAVVPSSSLVVGQQIVADYTPLYGFQRYYHTSSNLDGPKTVYLLKAVDPDDISVLEWDGRVYRVQP